jgi:hypothetical protein
MPCGSRGHAAARNFVDQSRAYPSAYDVETTDISAALQWNRTGARAACMET